MDAFYSINAVARRTGLSPHVIRIWEKRYRAVEPTRTQTNRRRYSDSEVERLSLLRDLTGAGHSIGSVANLDIAKLRDLAGAYEQPQGKLSIPNSPGPASLLADSIAAVKNLDPRALEEVLKRGSMELGAQGLLQRVIAPLAQAIGDLWRDGVITAAHEHFASAVIRIFLGHAAQSFVATGNAPVIVVGTPSGQLHELGALLVGATAANLGWNVTYLGASLPAAEIAGAARQNRARAVALSLVYPEDDPRLEAELERLRELLLPETAVLAGGRAVRSYRAVLDRTGALSIKDLSHLCSALEELRRPVKGSAR